jgi:hypothetical protein
MHANTYIYNAQGFSKIELNYKEGMKMYVDGGRVVTTMSI